MLAYGAENAAPQRPIPPGKPPMAHHLDGVRACFSLADSLQVRVCVAEPPPRTPSPHLLIPTPFPLPPSHRR